MSLKLLGAGDAAVIIQEDGKLTFHVVKSDHPSDEPTYAQKSIALIAWALNDEQTCDRFLEELDKSGWKAIMDASAKRFAYKEEKSQ